MARFHSVTGAEPGDKTILTPYTQAEEDARDVEEAEWAKGNDMRTWKVQIAESDDLMLRELEDFIDNQNISLNPGITKDNYDAKKVVRARKPT